MGQTHQREAAIFDAALELPPEQRAAHLDRACGGDAALRQRIESLLKAGESSCGLLDSPADTVAVGPTNALPASFEKAGDRIGRYKLLQQIGEGGCGVVYMAEQEEPVSRRVALKVIKLGLDTKSVIARFEAERQALALMDHPNIAKVLDAGATETGRPYFVMELVRGLKITEYCDEARLSTKARLDLFIQVCQAIQHAHQKGIIHRDIKPSNILVTINDGVPVPKVIDFGVAKATGGLKLTNKTVFTAFEQFIGTPAYMSPEQAVLTSLDIDTRSDIYALGVLLYELLTGKTPFDAKELLAIGLDEMRRTIREQEPPRPSTRLSTLPGQELSTTAQRRGLDAPKLVSELRGDLDWIVMKALEKDRARRYETANGLAADIQRHLNNEPVVACPPSRVYRFQKLVRRNKLAFAAGTAVATALVIGIIASAWQAERAGRAERLAKAGATRAERAEQAARAEKESAEAVLQFFRDKVLAAGRPEGEDGGLGIDVTLRQAIDAAESEIGKAFGDRPLVEASIRNTLGKSYIYLGQPSLAISQLERALALRRERLGLEDMRTLDAMNDLGRAYLHAGKIMQALPLFEESLKLTKAQLGPEHPGALDSMNNLALAYTQMGRRDQALQLHEETFKLTKAKLGPEHPDTLTGMNNLGLAYRNVGKLDKAIPLLEEALRLGKAKRGPEHPNTLTEMHNLGLFLQEAGELDRAVPVLEEAFKLRKAKLGLQHPGTLLTLRELLRAYEFAGNVDQALPHSRELLKLRVATRGPDHPDTLHARFLLGRVLVEAAKLHSADLHRSQELALEGEQLIRDYLPGVRSHYTNDPLKLAGRLHDVAEVRYRQGDYVEAEALYREIIELRRPRLSANDKDMLEPTANLARLLSDWAWAERTNIVAAEVRRLASSNSLSSTLNSQLSPHDRAREAERLLRDVLAVRLRDTNSWRIGDVKSRLGAALVSVAVTDAAIDAEARQAKLRDAESLLLDGHERLQKASRRKYQRDALQRLVRLYEALSKPEQKAEWQQKLDAFDQAQKKLPPSEPLTEDSLEANAATK